MPKMAACVCGQQVQIPVEKQSQPPLCPACGRKVSIPSDQHQSETVGEEIPDSAFVETPTAQRKSEQPVAFIEYLLAPATIQRLLFLGGGLSVIGLIAWLISLGVFDDPLVLAFALGAGTLALLTSGWGVVLRTQHRLAGQALTFLACVVAPLNLWFYSAQELLTIDGHLWVGGLVCSLLYLITVWKLRDPLFLYAVEAGVTLTVLLLLGDFQRATDSIALCVAMVVLSALSIHAETAFDANHPVFSRRRFGLPLFFSGQGQLAVGMISLLFLQTLNWTLSDVLGDWSRSQLANTPWLAGGLWLTAAYLWLYSDFAVRRLSIYTYLSALALILAEVTLLYPNLPVEALIIALSMTGLVVQFAAAQFGDSKTRWASTAGHIGTLLGVITLSMGLMRHFNEAVLGPTSQPLLYIAALLSVSVQLGCLALRQSNRGTAAQTVCWMGTGLSMWVAAMHGLDRAGIEPLVQQLPLLALVPLAAILIASVAIDRKELVSTVVGIHLTALIGAMVCLISSNPLVEWAPLIEGHRFDRSTLLSAVFFLEMAGLCFLTHRLVPSKATMLGCGGIWIAAASWKLMVFFDLSEIWFGPLLSMAGVVLIVLDRFQPDTIDATATPVSPIDEPKPASRLASAGNLCLILGELVVFFQTFAWMFGPPTVIPTASLIAVITTIVVSLLGSVVTSEASMRGWHRFATAIVAITLAVTWIRTQNLADYQKLELLLEVIGLAWLSVGVAGRLQESDQRKSVTVGLSLWMGSLFATLPVFYCTLMHRWSSNGPSMIDEIGLITIAVAMIAIGCVLHIRSTTSIGGLIFGSYLIVLFGHLAYHPQVAIGVYLAAGGLLIFMTGVMLSIYRDRLLALPAKISNREGVFQIIDWR